MGDLGALLAELWRVAALEPALSLAALGPLDAAIVAAHAEGRPDLAAEVRALVVVESRGVAVGVHTRHARRVPWRAFYAAAVRVRYLDPAQCPEHAPGDGARWGVRGAAGLVAAYSVRYLWACAPPEALDDPLVSAVVAVRRLVELERRYGLRSPAERAEAWRRGVGRWRARG